MSNDRFQRQASLVPRDRLLNTMFTIIGVGAIGRQVALQLASTGATNLRLIDFDIVDATNVTTQGYTAKSIGKEKVAACANDIASIDSAITVETIVDRFRPKHARSGVTICCVDKISARAAIWRACKNHCDLWIDGRMLGEVIRVLVANPSSESSHYDNTLFDQSDAQVGSCTSKSTIYTASIAAGLITHQISRWLRDLPTDSDTMFNILASEIAVI